MSIGTRCRSLRLFRWSKTLDTVAPLIDLNCVLVKFLLLKSLNIESPMTKAAWEWLFTDLELTRPWCDCSESLEWFSFRWSTSCLNNKFSIWSSPCFVLKSACCDYLSSAFSDWGVCCVLISSESFDLSAPISCCRLVTVFCKFFAKEWRSLQSEQVHLLIGGFVSPAHCRCSDLEQTENEYVCSVGEMI